MAEYRIDIEKSAQNILDKIYERFGVSAERLVELAKADQVGRMRGEWISTGAISCKCSRCNHLEPKYRVDEYNCCPYCMAPMTDEAVQMVMERLEALHDNRT